MGEEQILAEAKSLVQFTTKIMAETSADGWKLLKTFYRYETGSALSFFVLISDQT